MSTASQSSPEREAELVGIRERLARLPLPVLRRVSAIVRQMSEHYAPTPVKDTK